MKSGLMAGCSLFLVLVLAGCGGGGNSVGSGGGGGTLPPTQPPVTPPPVISITSASLPGAISGVAYSTALTASGGTLPYSWTVVTALPYFSLSTDGVLGGTYPSFLGGNSMTIQVRVTDSAATPNTAFKSLKLDVFGMTPNQLDLLPQVGESYPENFIQALGGVEPIQWQVSGTLPPGLAFRKNPAAPGTTDYLIGGVPTQAGSFSFSITATDSGSPARSVSRTYSVGVEHAKLRIPTSLLPVAVVGQPFSFSLAPTGGMAPFQFNMTTNPGTTLPPGLLFNQTTGMLAGTPTAPGYVGFSLNVSDHSTPNTQKADWNYWLLVVPAPLASHNDSVATAVPIYPGDYTASISPLRGNGGNLAADEDYYQVTAAAGSTLTIAVANQVYKPTTSWTISLLDPVLELVDANGHRLNSCNDLLNDVPSQNSPIPPDPTPNGFDDQCMNWTGDGVTLGSFESVRLALKVPGSSGTTTFYVHVFDWRGDARPDMFYTLSYTQP